MNHTYTKSFKQFSFKNTLKFSLKELKFYDFSNFFQKLKAFIKILNL